jgi:hypothetical protein
VPLFRRKEPRPATAARDGSERIAAFWSWWSAEGAARTAAAIADREPQRMVDELSRRFAAVHERLAWELAPGQQSEHLLVASPEGDAELRAVARRWLRGAPAPSEVWGYADARQASGDLTGLVLNVGGVDLPLGELTFAARPADYRLDVTLHHPALVPLPERDRLQIAFLALDSAIGEEPVETWIGEIGVSTEPLPGAQLLDELSDALDQHRRQHLAEDGGPTWRLMRADRPEGPLMVTAMVPLSPTVAAQFDDHVQVVVPFAGRTPEGLPDEATLDGLRALEDHLTERLGGSGMTVAVETLAGRRILHYYVDSTTPAADVLKAAVTGWPDGGVDVRVDHDAGWHGVRQFG